MLEAIVRIVARAPLARAGRDARRRRRSAPAASRGCRSTRCPDITNVQVQINTEAPGYSPLEVEQRITFPIETALAGLPRLEYTRSLSRYGLSQVTVVFEDGTDIYFARQLVNERLREAMLAAARRASSPRSVRSRPGSARSSCAPSRREPGATDERRAAVGHRRRCARSRTGWSSRSSAPCPASPRSTRSAAS